MKVTLQRDTLLSCSTQKIGRIYIDDEFICYTLELPWLNNQRRISCIPKGEYTVVKRYSPKYKNHFHILEVENRDWILIHIGNYHTDTLGCILPGLGLVDINGDGIKDVTSSGKAMNLLNKKLPSEFKLEIC